MFTRIKQFMLALNPRLDTHRLELISAHLNKSEQALFFSMDKIDQRHCTDVALTCLKLLGRVALPVNQDLLLRAALLHDVGKCAGDMNLWERVWVVLLEALWPAWLNRLARNNRAGAYYIALHHADIGARRCKVANCPPDLVRLVALHQTGGDGIELSLLMTADRLN